jgi:hypothetical protein
MKHSGSIASNVLQLPEGGDFEAFTVNYAETLIEAQSLIKPLYRHFWVAAVICRCSLRSVSNFE